MNLVPAWVVLSFAFLTLSVAEDARRSAGMVPQNNAVILPPRPEISKTFQVEVEAIFKNRRIGADGTLYYDQPNNIAVMDILWQGDFARRIYSFDTNELISIKGYECGVTNIPDDPGQSFFPFTVDSESKRKKIASPEESLYFKNSKYIKDVYDEAMEAYLYQGYMDIPMYQRKNCSIIHRFSKSDFETATCDTEFCKPMLLTISVTCEGVPGESEDVDHLYKFFHFTDVIQDESVFHPPPGVYCDRKQTKGFPFPPLHFSFSYDIVKHEANIEGAGGLQILHKKVWYDGDFELIRVDGFDKDGLLHDTRIYDFYNEVSYIVIPQLNQTNKEILPKDLTLGMVTLLPSEVFPRKHQQPSISPLYVGLRKAHGQEYHVWSSRRTEDGFEVVTEMYFMTTVSEIDGEIKESGFQLSYLEVYVYYTDDESESTELSEITFAPVTNFQNVSYYWSVFDVSSWFDSSEKLAFEISITGPKLIPGSKSFEDFLQQLCLEMLTAASVSITRFSKLEMIPSETDLTSNITNFRGLILEHPYKLGYGKQNNESDLNATFSELEDFFKAGGLEFFIYDRNGEKQAYILHSFRPIKIEEKDDKNDCDKNDCDKNDCDKNDKKKYTSGSVAGISVTVFLVGVVVGSFALIVFKKIWRKKPPGQ